MTISSFPPSPSVLSCVSSLFILIGPPSSSCFLSEIVSPPSPFFLGNALGGTVLFVPVDLDLDGVAAPPVELHGPQL